MSKIYSKTYSTHYAQIAKASPALIVPAGSMVCFAIPFPSEGFLDRLVIRQATGDLIDFEVELLNSQLPYPPGEYDVADEPADDLISYRVQMPVTAPLTQTAGETLSLTHDDYGLPFRNVDGGWTLNQRMLYLLIRPIGGSGPQGPQGPQSGASTDTTWNVTLQCRTDIG